MSSDYSNYFNSLNDSRSSFDVVGDAVKTRDKTLAVIHDPSGKQTDQFVLSTSYRISVFASNLFSSTTKTSYDSETISKHFNATLSKTAEDIDQFVIALTNDENITEQTLREGIETLHQLKISLIAANVYLKDNNLNTKNSDHLVSTIQNAIRTLGDKLTAKQVSKEIAKARVNNPLSSQIQALKQQSEAGRSFLAATPQPPTFKEQWLDRATASRLVEVQKSPENLAKELIKGHSEYHPGESINKPIPMQDAKGKWLQVPSQLYQDMKRFQSVKLNGKTIFIVRNDNYDPIDAYRQICKQVSKGSENLSSDTKENAPIGNLEAQRIASLMNQGMYSDLWQNMNIVGAGENPAVMYRGGLGTHFEVQVTATTVIVTAKLAFSKHPLEDPEKNMGAVMVKRTIEIPRSELIKENIDDIKMTINLEISRPLPDASYAAEKIKEF